MGIKVTGPTCTEEMQIDSSNYQEKYNSISYRFKPCRQCTKDLIGGFVLELYNNTGQLLNIKEIGKKIDNYLDEN